MITQSRFEALSDSIVGSCYPEKKLFWAANKREIVGRLYRAEDINLDSAGQDGDFKFVGELIQGLQVTGAGLSIVSTMITIYKSLKEHSDDCDNDKVKKLLEQSGITTEQAIKILEIVSSQPESSATPRSLPDSA